MTRTAGSILISLFFATTLFASEPEAASPESPATALDRAVLQALEDRSSPDSLHLAVACLGDHGMRSLEVYGNGVGIWDFRRQFTLSPEAITALLRQIRDAGFATFADVYGGKKPDPQKPDRGANEKGEGHALQIICRVALSLDGESKEVSQIGKGEQSAELKELAEGLLSSCEEAGLAGKTAADLTDGLEQVGRGELAPETFRLLLNRKPQAVGSDGDGGGFLLRIEGRRVTSRPAAGEEARSLMLTSAEVSDLARELAGLHVGELPLNLYAADYRDLAVEVLNHERSVQARQFADMTASTHGERQRDFDRIYERLYELERRVMSAGG